MYRTEGTGSVTAKKIDAEFIGELGFDELTERERRALAQAFYESLDVQVGYAIAEDLTYDELDAFEVAMREGESAALAWLEAHVPDHQKVVSAKKAELAEVVAKHASVVSEKIVQART
jgi:Protein of unknown function (DUF5663)